MNLPKISKKELRHLNSSEMMQLAAIIDKNDNWIKILEAIPKDLNKISNNNLNGEYERKYKSDDAAILRNAAQIQQRSPSHMLLFEEWGTSGRQRPTIQHLYELLISLPLFRAADYIAKQILRIQEPNRPDTGSSKRIDITLPELGIDSNQMRDILEAFRCPNSISIEHSEFDTNHENQDKNYGKSSPYNKSIGLPTNQSTESSSKLCSSSEPTELTETDSGETSEDSDTTRTNSYTNKISDDIERVIPAFEQIGINDDLSLLEIVIC